MRIGILSQFRERSLSGIPKVVAGTVSELKELTVQDDLLYIGEEPFLPVQLPFVDIPYAGWEKYHLDFCLHGNDIDVLHSFYYAFHYDNPRCKKILTIHDLIHVAHPEWFFKTSNDYFSGLLKECAKKVDMIVAVSENTKKDIVHYYDIPPQKVKVIYNGLYPKLNMVENDMTEVTKKLHQVPYILSVSAVHEYKNQIGLIKAYEIFRQRNKDINIKLVLTGSVRKDVYMEDVVKDPSIRKDIIFTGYVSESDLVWLYKNAYAFCCVSWFEGFGLPVLEAMSYGAAVICSNTTSLPEVGGDAVCYCNPYDLEDIADKIELLLRDEKLREKLKYAGLERANLFSYKKAASQLMELYRE